MTLRRAVALVGIVALGIVEALLGAWSEQAAAMFPEVAHLRVPVLALTVAFCAAGQVALFLTALARARAAVVALLVAMAGSLLAVLALTQAAQATPPLVGLGATGGILICLVIAITTAVRGRRQTTRPAARAGSA
ncbi:hypothetical protein [Pseudolysinimonas sp.]